jgi:NADH:ubiquinone oxidoreductase subunit
MDRLSELRVPPAWSSALIASLDEPPPRARSRRRPWVIGLALILAGLAGFAVWFTH